MNHVLKTDGANGSSAAVYARLNQNGGANLLTHVDEPLGGSFDLSYARAGNTVAMPESRYVLVGVQLHQRPRAWSRPRPRHLHRL